MLHQIFPQHHEHDDHVSNYITTLLSDYITTKSDQTLEDLYLYISSLNPIKYDKFLSAINDYERQKYINKSEPQFDMCIEAKNIIFHNSEDTPQQLPFPKNTEKFEDHMTKNEKKAILGKYFLEEIKPTSRSSTKSFIRHKHGTRQIPEVTPPPQATSRVRFYNNQIVSQKGERFIEINKTT